MKRFLVLLCAACVVSGEAPYPSRGWKPNGPAFGLPEKNSQKPQNQYLPPGDPRNLPSDSSSDVSVQGLPVEEQIPEFQVSPVSGQQYVGPDFNADIARLNERYRQELIEQQRIKELIRQQTTVTPTSTSSTFRAPAQFPNFKTTPIPEEEKNTTDASDLNTGEVSPDKDSVEVSKQNIQEYPELLLTPLTQLRLVKNGKLVDSQKSNGFDGPIHLAALQSILRQNHQVVQNQEVIQNQAFIAPQEANRFLIIPQNVAVNQQAEQQYQIQPVILQPQEPYSAPKTPVIEDVEEVEDKKAYQPQPMQPQQFQQPQIFQAQPYPQQTFQVQQQLVPQQIQPQAQFQPQQYQPQQFQPQQFQPEQYQPQQFVPQQYQPQPQQYQPQQFQPQQYQPTGQQYQPQQIQPQSQIQDYQNQFLIQPQAYQPLDLAQFYKNQVLLQQSQTRSGQDALQSGFEVDQENGVEDKEETTEKNNGDGSATAVATAFGARTRPRVLTQYGAPEQSQTTTMAPNQDEAPAIEDGPAIAVATAEARGHRKSSKLRNRRVRPVFTVDQSGHLVLSQD